MQSYILGANKGINGQKVTKTGFLVMIHTILVPLSKKSRSLQQNLGAYASGKVDPCLAGAQRTDMGK